VLAVRSLKEIDASPQTTVPLFVDLLQDNHIQVRREAILALGALGPKAKETVGPLTNIAGDQQDPARKEAARALELIAGKAPARR
jgi:HEAT repeat protein